MFSGGDVSVRAMDVAMRDFFGGRLAHALHFCLEAEGEASERVVAVQGGVGVADVADVEELDVAVKPPPKKWIILLRVYPFYYYLFVNKRVR